MNYTAASQQGELWMLGFTALSFCTIKTLSFSHDSLFDSVCLLLAGDSYKKLCSKFVSVIQTLKYTKKAEKWSKFLLRKCPWVSTRWPTESCVYWVLHREMVCYIVVNNVYLSEFLVITELAFLWVKMWAWEHVMCLFSWFDVTNYNSLAHGSKVTTAL